MGTLACKARIAALAGVHYRQWARGLVKGFLEKQESWKLAKKQKKEEEDADKTKKGKAKDKEKDMAKAKTKDALKTIKECAGVNFTGN